MVISMRDGDRSFGDPAVTTVSTQKHMQIISTYLSEPGNLGPLKFILSSCVFKRFGFLHFPIYALVRGISQR